MIGKKMTVALLGTLCLAALGTTVLLLPGPSTNAFDDNSWFASFEGVQVAPTARSDTTQLVEAGVLETDGFSELVFSLGGEFKQQVPSSGTVGALLIPNEDVFEHLLRLEETIVFPLEATADISREMRGALFLSQQQTARVAFPSYRVYFYNETTSAASVSLFVYRSRY